MSLFVSLVDQLAARHEGGSSGSGTSHSQDVEERIARLFLIACDLMAAFRPADLRLHLDGMMGVLHATLLQGDGLQHAAAASSDTAADHAPPSPESVPTLIAASGALVGYVCAHVEALEDGGVAAAWVAAVAGEWESSVLQLLSAQPPFTAEARTAACYAVAQLSLLPSAGCCPRVLQSACEALEVGREDGLNATLATELLGQVTSLMVVCRPFQLRGAVLENPSPRPCAAKGAAKKAPTSGMSASQGSKRAKLATQRPALEGGGGLSAEDAEEGARHPADACTAIPSCYPFPCAARLARLKQDFIQSCLSALGARGSDGGGAAYASAHQQQQQQQQQQQHRAVPTALICQRVLIPLLLLDGSQGLEQYEALVHSLLHTLAARPATASELAHRRQEEKATDADQHQPMAGGVEVGQTLRSENCDEVVLLIAALFDFLFRQPSLDPQTDFRFSHFLWSVLSSALHRSLTATEMDAGRRANMQLRVEYLLKRIVYMTKLQDLQQQQQQQQVQIVRFHTLFCWTAAASPNSATAWDNFFLVLESLNEYGWHIIEPVMARFDSLVAQLEAHLADVESTGKASAAAAESAALHPCWVEMLLLKIVLHPNLGVRKVGLRRVWALPPRVLRALSSGFLFKYAFQSASDPRLCGDIDRVPIAASFLDTKSFEGAEVRALPDVEPLAQEVERFYASIFLARWDGAPAEVAVAGRVDALHRFLDTTVDKPPRFTVCVLARALLAMAQVLLDHHIDATPIVLEEGLLARLHRFMRDSVQENIPFWLDVRVTAILFAALTTLAAATAQPRVCRQHPSFWRLYCLCGPLGESGGHSITSMDACGQYGLVGASIEEGFLQHWLLHLSSRMEQPPPQQEGSGGSDAGAGALTTAGGAMDEGTSLMEALLDVRGVVDRVDALLHARQPLDALAIKETFFLLGTLTRTSCAAHRQVVRTVADRIAATVTSLQTRAYCSAAQVLSSAACVVEFQHTVGSAVCAELWPLGTTLQAMSAALHGHVLAALQAGLRRLSEQEGSPAPHSVDGAEAFAAEPDATWALLKTEHFDMLAAAITALNTIATSAACVDAATRVAELLQAPQHVRQLMDLLHECATACAGAASQQTQRLAALLVVYRDVARLLQSELCGFLAVAQNGSVAANANAAAPRAGWLPTCREAPASSAAATSRCPSALSLPRADVEAYVGRLMALPAQRAPSCAVPSALSNVPWSALLGQQGRYVCNALYVLLLSMTSDVSPLLVARVQDYALGQLGECWTMNLACVYDVLLWVASADVKEAGVVDHVAIAEGMWEHMREVGARQYTRLAALAFTALHYVMPHHPTYVKERLLCVLKGEGKEAQTADRDVYFAAVTASLQVLHDPTANWSVLREVLLYAAVLFNTNRDEEENESTVAVTEPLLQGWPDALRLLYPPTTRMSAVGRAMAVSTLLWCCHSDVAGRAVPLTMALLRMNTCHPVVTHEPCMPNSRTHRTRIRLWQLLCALLPCLAGRDRDGAAESAAEVEEAFRVLVSDCLPINNMGSVRRLMELYAIRLIELRPSLYTVLCEALGVYNLRPQVCGSYILVACHALLQHEAGLSQGPASADGALAQNVFAALFPRVLQQSTSNQHLLRIISHIGLVNVCQRRLARGCALEPAVAAIYDYVVQAPEHVRFREKHEHILFFDSAVASSPRHLFCVQRKEANTVLAEVLPAAAFERLRFVETEMCSMIGALYPMELLRVHDWCASLRVQERVSVFQHFTGIPHTSTPCEYYVDYTREATELLTRDPMLDTVSAVAAAKGTGCSGGADDADGVDAATANVQKKVSSWWTSEVYNELHPRALRTQKQSIIVVGSLLENPVNIAGLCRCGEIFAVESIVVPEKKVFEHPHFVAAARSAELWIPWEEVLPKDLPGYLEGLRRRGYAIVGIEQTAASVSMETFDFPARCAVVLGAEGQGVPAPLIPLLDVCVEIPQYGLIRSLNVHVTGAITMYEYTRQHLMSQSHASM